MIDDGYWIYYYVRVIRHMFEYWGAVYCLKCVRIYINLILNLYTKKATKMSKISIFIKAIYQFLIFLLVILFTSLLFKVNIYDF